MCIYTKKIRVNWICCRMWRFNSKRELSLMMVVADSETFDFIRRFKIII